MFGADRRLGARALRFPGRRIVDALDRSAVRAADGGRRHHADHDLRAERLARRAAGAPTASRSRSRRSASRIALIFIGLPFVVRTLQPVIEDSTRGRGGGDEPRRDAAGASLTRVILPYLYPAWLTGFALAFARAVGEYGSVVFISGNMPMRTEISPLLIITKLEQYDYPGATAIALVMLLDVVRAAARHQRAAGLEQPPAGALSAWRWLDPFTHARAAPRPTRRHLTEPPLLRWALTAIALAFLGAVPRAAARRRCSSRRFAKGSAAYRRRDRSSPTRWRRCG